MANRAHSYRADRYAANPEYFHNWNLKRLYGITADDYQEMLANQGGQCHLCDQKPDKRRLDVDHDHVSGRVRGLLCMGCNARLVGRLEQVGPAKVLAYLESTEDLRPY